MSNKLNEKSEYIQNYLTGGTGFPFIDIRNFATKLSSQQNCVFQVENDFDYPLYNVSIDVFDYDILQSKSHFESGLSEVMIKIDDYKKAKIMEINYQEIPSKEYRTIDKKFIEKEGRYLINIHSRNMTTVERIAILKLGEGYYYGFQVINLKGEVLKQLIKEDMPEEIRKLVIDKLKSIPNNMKYILEE